MVSQQNYRVNIYGYFHLLPKYKVICVDGKLELNKQDVNIIAIEPVGHYAIKLIFDDGHQTGIILLKNCMNLEKIIKEIGSII